jgi:hypothetical protein
LLVGRPGLEPGTWWLRGPLLGALAMLLPSLLALATPRCGFT